MLAFLYFSKWRPPPSWIFKYSKILTVDIVKTVKLHDHAKYCSNQNKCSAVAEMGDRLATIDMDWKSGVVHLWGRGSWVLIWHSVACAKAYLPNKWNLDASSRLATIDMARKLLSGFCAHFWGFPSNTMRLWPRPTSVLNGILIHPAVWPQ